MSTTLINNYRQFLQSGSAMRAELDRLLKGAQYLPDALIDKLAGVHASHYGAFAKQSETTGAWVFFESAEDTTNKGRHAAANKQWSRTIAPHHDYSRREVTRNKQSEVDRLLGAFNKLSLREQRAFIKSLPNVI